MKQPIEGMASKQTVAAFTLLELLVVMAILAVVTGLAVSRVNFRTQHTPVMKETERIHILFDLIQEESILWDRLLALEIDRQGYQILEERSGQLVLASSKLFRPKTWPQEVRFNWISGGEQDPDSKKFIVLFYPTGQTSPYEFSLTSEVGSEQSFLLSSEGTGEFKIEAE